MGGKRRGHRHPHLWKFSSGQGVASQELTLIVLWDWLVLVDLDLDTALRLELRYIHTLHNLLEDGWISFAFQTVVEGVEVGGGDEVGHIEGL